MAVNYGAVARRQRSAPSLRNSESQPLLASDIDIEACASSSSSSTTINDLGEEELRRKNGKEHNFFTHLFSRKANYLVNPEDRLYQEDDEEETWASTQLGAPDMVAVNLVITLSTAMLDAVMFRLYRTFATNQTGNTVFLTLAAVHWGSARLIHAVASLCGFFTAGLIMGQLGARFGHRRRWWVVTSMVFQCVVLLIFTWVVSPLGHPLLKPGAKFGWAGMLISAIQGGPQVVMATNLGVPEMPTAMVTSAYAGLISDIKLFSKGFSVPRDRRIVYLVTFWVGSFVGLAVEQTTSAWFASFLSALLKIIALLMILRARPSGVSGSARA